MTTSGTYAFNPSAGAVAMHAFRRLGIKRNDLTAEHMLDAREEANYLQVEWSNKGVKLWAIDLQTVALTQGVATLTLDAATIGILDVFIRTTDATGNNQDRIITPMSRTEYASQPNKAAQAPPTAYWFNRQVTPTLTLFPVPDGGGPYTLCAYRMRQLQDVVLPGGATLDAPYRYLDAFVYGLAARLAPIYAADRFATADTKAKESFGLALGSDVEMTPVFITPMLSTYYRQ